MSVVTNLILFISSLENEEARISEVNKFTYNGRQMNLVSVDYNKDMSTGYSWYGGTKFLEATIYIGAFNQLDIEKFRDYLRTLDWEASDLVQLIVKDDNDMKFKILEL
jgi:transposase